MRRGLLVAALLASGCYARHERSVDASIEPRDAGPSRYAGRWLVDQPFHAGYEGTYYDLAPDGRFVELCTVSFDGDVTPVGFVERASDGRRCELVGPWDSLGPDVLSIEGYCDDSVRRTVVLDFVWADDRPSEVTIQKVDGEREGWSHPGFEWRWLPCAASPGDCDICG
ncbi:MAG: hypothetical protein H6719_08155 [Sandaracinaceae bacterium]|nr:hypothetical protein [Sandaracinaceae bacterium]